MNKHQKRARNIISKILYITIATADKKGNPWNTPVYSAFDKNYNFYWMSQTTSQHSRNIKENPNVFLVIYNSRAEEGEGEGVYIQAAAYEVEEEKEIRKAIAIMWSRVGKDPKAHKPKEFLDESPIRVYKAVPEKFWVNDAKKFDGKYLDFRIEIKL